MVLHDEKRIQQVLLNLQSNALKFTETGSVVIKADIKKQDEDEYLKLSVEDTGYGIKPEEKDKLFKMFGYLEDKNKVNIHGIGLGLNLSKRIVEQFGGKISVHSELGVGSTFEFTLRLYKHEK